ncbi:MAG: S8 family peptidase [Bacteroidales bacterium]|nr:S8 family peptidase [Bacteroidales bacterium]
MKKLSVLLLFIAITLFSQAQVATNIYWVQFTDKNNSPYSIDNPEAYLSPRALQRRANLGISIDEYDLPVNPQYLQAVADCGAELLNPSKWLNGVTVHVTDPAVIEAINALEFVEVTRNCPNDLKAQEKKERWLAKEMQAVESVKGFRGYYGGGTTQITQINGMALHDSGYQGQGVVIAILDGGFIGTETHPAFANMRDEGRLLGTRDFVYGSTSVYSQSTHGTSCLSTMAAYVPNTFVGTAPKASYYLLHTEDAPNENIVEEYNWVSGAEYADSLGVDVCSTSLGYIGFDMSEWDHPQSHFDGKTAPASIGAEIAVSRGMICLNSAGNEGEPWDDSGYCTLGVPADAEHVLTIGAVDGDGNRAWFSSVGPTYDGRIKPDVMAMGQDTYVASSDGGYYNGSGTSFSNPVMAGAVACLRQARPYASVQEICDAVRACSDRANNPDNRYGYGIPDFSQALELLSVEEPTGNTPAHIISVYPNPSNGEVHVALNELHKAELTVYDIMGRKLYAYSFNGLNHTTLERYLNTLSDGVYFINAVSQSGSETLKLVITK